MGAQDFGSRLRLALLSGLRKRGMAPLVDGWDYASWSAVYNALTWGIAGMGSATIFFWLEISNVNKKYRTALAITGLVTAIATYHYFWIFNSWNDAYRYVDWVLTVPLLLIELILVMGLPAEETVAKSLNLGVASAIMVALGYPGEIQDNPQGRWMWWF